MFRKILIYGLIAGVVVGGALFGMMVLMSGGPPLEYGELIGYSSMLIALSAVFVGVKRYRDEDRGGVIGFWPALGMGLAISLVASLCYTLAWEASLAVTHADFIGAYTAQVIAQKQAAGVSAAELAQFTAEMNAFKEQYANPLFRMLVTVSEILPVGVLVSLISAALLRNSRFLPARR